MNIFFMGSKRIGLECLKILHGFCEENVGLNLEGVLTNPRGKDITDYCIRNGLRLVDTLDGYLEFEKIDLNISVQYHEILLKKHIDNSVLSINLHMAPLPEYRGCNQFSAAILDKVEEFGTTIHLIHEGIDSGDILFEDRFEIDENIWVNELYQMTFERSVSLFEKSLPKILNRDFNKIEQSSLMHSRSSKVCYRKDIEVMKLIDLTKSKDEIERQIRATSMPGFEPPYAIINNKKVYMSLA